MFYKRKMNLIVVFNMDLKKVLFCIRAKEPYKGLYNFVGGKVEEDETNDEAAYRELYEKTMKISQRKRLLNNQKSFSFRRKK